MYEREEWIEQHQEGKVNAHSWLGIGIILTSTHLYMNIAIRR